MPPSRRMSLTPYQLLLENWKECTRCDLCETRRKVVMGRGSLPADVVLIGEAPGESENIVGLPFVGPAGHLLNHILQRSLDALNLSYAITNLISCIPRDDDPESVRVGKLVLPPEEAIEACAPRLYEFVRIANPKFVVAVGSEARDWLDPKRKYAVSLPRRCPVCKQMQSGGHFGPGGTVNMDDTPVTCINNHKGKEGVGIPQVAILHPAAILRLNVAQRGFEIQRAVAVITTAAEEHCNV